MATWEVKKFEDVLSVLRNGVNCKQNKKGGGNKISRIESISNADFDIEKVGYAELSKSDKDKYKLNRGDILFSHINSPIHVGKTALFNSEDEVYHGVNLLLMRPKPCLDVNYFEHYLKYLFQNGYWKGLCKQSVNQASVNQQDINKVEIHYPKSISEQKRIVAILDEAFESISKAKENAENNLKNATEIFESYLQSVFENKGEEWEEKTLDAVCKISSKLIDPREETYIDLCHIGGANIESITGCLIDLKTSKEENLISGKFPFDNSMILYSKIRPYLVKVVRPDFSGICSADIYPLKPVDSILDRDFLYFLLITKDFTNFAIKGSARAGMPKVNRKHLFSYSTFFPTLPEQQSIVSKLDALSTETKKLEAIYTQKLADLDELKKSILQKAFEGKLT
ncbi:MAG: restriction endonuclease subunit S [ANME-2 cluster archaeon]|nr:restriction endonuclease subunit S [ANME-2 cluster archaeon]